MRRYGRAAFGATLLATTTVLAPAAAVAARPAGHLAVRAVWPSVTTSGVVAVAGSVTASTASVRLALQRRFGSHWKTVDWTSAGKSGRYSFLLRSSAQQAIWHLRVVRTAPAQVSGQVTVRIVAAPSGIVKAWGDNAHATLGDGTRQTSLTPVTVSGLTGVVGLASGHGVGYALRSDGMVWSWGDNLVGALDYSRPVRGLPEVPTQVAGLARVTAIAASGGGTGYALRRDGTVWSWGSNQSGELGSGNTNDSVVPRPIRGLAHIVAISGGAQDGYALRSDGTVWGWGEDGANQLGAAASYGEQSVAVRPIRVEGMSDAVAIAGGSDSLYVLRSDGTVWGAGIPFGAADHSYPPPRGGVHELGQVPGLHKIIAIAGGGSGGSALRSDGAVVGWGVNSDGAIGDGTRVEHLMVPVPVQRLTRVTGLCQDSGDTGCALDAGGTDWVWGRNASGALGDGSTLDSLVPHPVPELRGVLAVNESEQNGYAVVLPTVSTG